MHESLVGYPVIIEQVVDWGDMDSFQHLNNVVYIRYFENARVAYFERMNWRAFLGDTGAGPILGTVQARFRRAVTYPDTLLVGVRVSSMGVDRYTMDYRLVSTKQNDLVTTGDSVVVAFDYRAGTKIAIPVAMRKQIEQIEGKSF
jgi:acyl-CoA thioester hydrolase